MRAEVRVAAIQMDVAWLDPEANLSRMREMAARACSDDKVDLLVFPELASSGYVTSREQEFMLKYVATAQKVPGAFTEGLARIAKEHRAYVVAGLLEAHPLVSATVYNSAVLLSPDGDHLGVFRKVHIPSEEKHYFYAGNNTVVYDTELGKLAVMICADIVFPELARLYALKGAEIVCIPTCRPRTSNPFLSQSLAVSRAFENQYYVIVSNRVGREGEAVYGGRSSIASPTGDELACSQTEEEDIVKATLDQAALVRARTWRTRFRDRRPELYSLLCEPL